MDLYEVAAILNDIGNFDVGDLGGRLALQKTIHLLQSFGINLGYIFAWLPFGAYSTALARDGLAVESFAPDMPEIPINFEADAAQRRYAEFKEFLKDRKHDTAMLDAASSMCYLDSIGMERGKILRRVGGKSPGPGAKQCERAWGDLERCGVVGRRRG